MIAAPFLGEFGWEVAMWAPWVRWQRKAAYPQRDFHVVCKKGHEGLYKDFADELIAIDPPKNITKIDCNLCWVSGSRLRWEEYLQLCKDAVFHHQLGFKVFKKDLITPLEIRYTWKQGEPPKLTGHQLPMSLPEKRPFFKASSVALHARMCEDKQPERNWPKTRWEELVPLIQRKTHGPVFSIGSVKGAYHVPGTTDFRGVSLEKLINLLGRQVLFVIGPSSGPLHLANQCGTPVIWWSANLKDQMRYATAWNPHRLKNLCAARETWQPSVERVSREVENMLRAVKR